MPPFRNPFARRPGPAAAAAAAAAATGETTHQDGPVPRISQPGFERVDTVGSKVSSAISIRSGLSARSVDTGDYKLSGMDTKPS